MKTAKEAHEILIKRLRPDDLFTGMGWYNFLTEIVNDIFEVNATQEQGEGEVKKAWMDNRNTTTPLSLYSGTMTYNLFMRAISQLSTPPKPDMIHCTGCGYHYDLLLEDCPTCKPEVTECYWQYDEEHCFYDTECGEAYCLMDGTLAENKHKHCPYCGKPIKEQL